MSELTLISGPNGSGKMTLSLFLLSKNYLDEQIPLINPDDIQMRENLDEFDASKKALVFRAITTNNVAGNKNRNDAKLN